MSAPSPFHVLVLCSHNRTRSVMAGALLGQQLGEGYEVQTAGFGPEGQPAMPEAVELLAERGLDVSGHRSRRVTPELVRWAHLVLTAEKDHVMRVVAELGGDFTRTFTLPEYVFYANSPHATRATGMAYMRTSVAELEDPTGRPRSVWTSAFAAIDQWCRSAATCILR